MDNIPLPPQGPKGNMIMGPMQEFTNDTLGFMEKWAEYGDISRINFGVPFGSRFTVVFVDHPDLIREVLVTKSNAMHKTTNLKRIIGRVLGENIFTADGDYWKRQRRLVTPAFHTRRISSYGETMVNYTERMLEHWADGETINMEEEMQTLTMQIVTKTLFNADVGEDAYRVGEAMRDIFTVINHQLDKLIPVPYWLPTQDNRTLRESGEVMKSLLQEIIDERRASGDDPGDLLSMLMQAQDEEDGTGMTDEQLLNELGTLFGAGHETTSVTLTWTSYLLSQHPEIAEKLYEEVDRVLDGRPATVEDLPNLPYTDMVIKESMRLYPPAWIITRQVAEDVEVGGYLLKENNIVVVTPWVVHRDARWFDQPDEFRPERFSADNEGDIPKYAYLPFGAGPRICVGNAFALMEARLLLATMIQRYRFELAPDTVVEPERRFTLHPKYGMKMIVHERMPEGAMSVAVK